VDGISFSLEQGRILGLGRGIRLWQELTALSILRLVPPPGRIAADHLRFEGQDLLAASEREMQGLRVPRFPSFCRTP